MRHLRLEVRLEPATASVSGTATHTVRALDDGLAAVTFDDVMLTWYANQGDSPLAPSRGQLYDHIGLSVKDLDAWTAAVRDCEVRCAEHGFGAAIASIGSTVTGAVACDAICCPSVCSVGSCARSTPAELRRCSPYSCRPCSNARLNCPAG